MKLFYYAYSKNKSTGFGNFGDELNPWLWSRLIPGYLDQDDSTQFVGIGTLLNDNVPNARQTVVFGSGVGYGDGLPEIDETWHIYCVRGPLSAKALNLPSALAVTDPAILIRRLANTENRKTAYRFTFMPHHRDVGPDWELICDELGFGFIHPCWDVETVLSKISQTEILIAEAMHGAIVADALRIPWIPVCASPRILAFKWRDWCASIGAEYKVQTLPRYWYLESGTLYRRLRNWARKQRIKLRLVQIAKNSQPVLSKDKDLDRLTVELEERLEQFKQDVSAGCYG